LVLCCRGSGYWFTAQLFSPGFHRLRRLWFCFARFAGSAPQRAVAVVTDYPSQLVGSVAPLRLCACSVNVPASNALPVRLRRRL